LGGGRGGQDTCLNASDGSGTGCGGRGHFYVVRVTGNFLDVASLEWVSDTNGNVLGGGPYFTDLQPAPQNGMPGQGPAFTEKQLGCRKLINSQIDELTSAQNEVSVTVSSDGTTYTVTNHSSKAIPGAVALQFANLDYASSAGGAVNLTNKAFVDRCVQGANAYLLPTTGAVTSLGAGK